MRISNLTVENFRAVKSVSIAFGATTALLGENNAGKSSILSALNLFFDPSPKVTLDDFHGRRVDDPIIVSIEFAELTPDEEKRFSGNLISGKLRVARKFYLNSPRENGRFFVEADVNPEFDQCRATDSAAKKRELYKQLQSTHPDLANVARAEDIDEALEAWEAANPHTTKRQLVSGFRGFKNVAAGQLREKTEVVFVPAVRDAADEISNEKSSPVKALLNTIAKQTIENSSAFREFKANADEELKRLTSPDNVPQLREISSELTNILTRYYADSELLASWSPISELPTIYPKSDLKVIDNKFEAPIEKVGHGLQRAILFSTLEYLARDRTSSNTSESTELVGEFAVAMSDIIIVIEEPEIFQHPIKQRLFREAFQTLSKGFGKTTGIRVQIVYTTHSPLMVDIKDFDQLCVIRRKKAEELPLVYVRQASLEACAKVAAIARGVEPRIDLFKRSLHIFTPEIAEGFFAKKVVLVEGEGDAALLRGFITHLGRDCLAEGMHVVPVHGKANIEKSLVIFSQLEIPAFVIFDNDQPDNKPSERDTNRSLQQICGHTDITDWPSGCFSRFAALNGKVEQQVRSAVGADHFNTTVANVADLHGLKPKDALKNPMVASAILGVFLGEKRKFEFLEEIVLKIDALTD